MGDPTYLVDTYVPGLDEPGARVLDRRVQEAVAALRSGGTEVAWRGSLTIAAEETYSYLLTCADAGVASAVSSVAALSCDHVAQVVLVPPPSG